MEKFNKKEKRGARISPKAIFAVSAQAMEPILHAQPLVFLNCNGILEVENHKGIVSYDTEKIVLNMGTVCVRIEGDSLKMDILRKNFIRIHGRIFAIHLCYERV